MNLGLLGFTPPQPMPLLQRPLLPRSCTVCGEISRRSYWWVAWPDGSVACRVCRVCAPLHGDVVPTLLGGPDDDGMASCVPDGRGSTWRERDTVASEPLSAAPRGTRETPPGRDG